jgi:hypothetical protein
VSAMGRLVIAPDTLPLHIEQRDYEQTMLQLEVYLNSLEIGVEMGRSQPRISIG